MTVTVNGRVYKQFSAIDRMSKVLFADVFSNATSHSAAVFLKKVIERTPFVIDSIQVDGGSEFMKEFEETCKDLSIPLYCLPPNKPKYNVRDLIEFYVKNFMHQKYLRQIFLNYAMNWQHIWINITTIDRIMR